MLVYRLFPLEWFDFIVIKEQIGRLHHSPVVLPVVIIITNQSNLNNSCPRYRGTLKSQAATATIEYIPRYSLQIQLFRLEAR